jgi:hypothetical protein
MQLAGYALRASLLDQPRPQLNYFTAMVALFFISPSLLAATNYLCLGKLLSISRAALPTSYKLRSSDHDSSSAEAAAQTGSGFAAVLGSMLGVGRVGFGAPGWVGFSALTAVTAAFCVGELVALILQGVGAALIATSAASSKFKESSRIKQQNGRWLLLAGVCMQLLVLTVFTGVVLAVRFGRKFQTGYAGAVKFRAVFGCLFATIVCQYVRQIFRVVVYVSGLSSFLATHERYGVCGFDFAPLIACGLLFCFLHYGFFFDAPRSEPEAADSVLQPQNSTTVLLP